MKSRFARFRNVPEMLRMWHVFADVKTGKQLDLPVPNLTARPADGQRIPETMTVEPSDDLLGYVAQLGNRAEKVRNRAVTPEEDNMLKISGDGRRAALDMRLVGLPQDGPGKTAAAARRIAALWHAHRDDLYRAPDGALYPVRGSLQLVFCDLGTPRNGWNAYGELRDQLTARGLPGESVRFVHDAKTDTDLARLFAACRTGHVAVLVGSTEKMGVGTNVQDRAIALHHLDAPWRPADVDQREGRILRQGNLNDEVQVIRYVTARSFDGYMWQTLERKAHFIHEIMNPALDAREVADVGDTVLSFSEAKALATGNPLLMDKAETDADLARLRRAERAHARDQDALRHAVTRHEQDIASLAVLTEEIDAAITRRQDTRGDTFAMTVDGQRHLKRADAGQQLKQILEQAAVSPDGQRRHTLQPGQLGGFQLTADIERSLGKTYVALALDGAPGTEIRLRTHELAEADPAGLVTRLENRLARLEERKARAIADNERARREIDYARDNIGRPFPQAAQLAAARDRAREIDEQLQKMATPPQQEQKIEAAPTPESPPAGTAAAGPLKPTQTPEPEDRPRASSPHEPGHRDRSVTAAADYLERFRRHHHAGRQPCYPSAAVQLEAGQ